MSLSGFDMQIQLARFLPTLRAFLQRSAPAGDVDDLVQDVLLRVQNRQGATIANMEAYLIQVARSALIDYARRNQVRYREQHIELTEGHHPADEITPDRVMVGEEQSRLLVSALRELPARTCDVLLMVRYEGMSYKQVARRLGISVSAVEKHVMKAMAHLAQRMQEGSR
jgi:RNA polymerase sigma-70 factor (ECF subfamily)